MAHKPLRPESAHELSRGYRGIRLWAWAVRAGFGDFGGLEKYASRFVGVILAQVQGLGFEVWGSGFGAQGFQHFMNGDSTGGLGL